MGEWAVPEEARHKTQEGSGGKTDLSPEHFFCPWTHCPNLAHFYPVTVSSFCFCLSLTIHFVAPSGTPEDGGSPGSLASLHLGFPPSNLAVTGRAHFFLCGPLLPTSLGPRQPVLQEEGAGFLGDNQWGTGKRERGGWYSCW